MLRADFCLILPGARVATILCYKKSDIESIVLKVGSVSISIRLPSGCQPERGEGRARDLTSLDCVIAVERDYGMLLLGKGSEIQKIASKYPPNLATKKIGDPGF
jgi:hypothetical protein